MNAKKQDIHKVAPITAYKTCLREIINLRPSGLRIRIAQVLGTHKSFISQITSPTDPTPLPRKHIDPMLNECHATEEERKRFLGYYNSAHPDSKTRQIAPISPSNTKRKVIEIEIVCLADRTRQRRLEALIRNFAKSVSELV